MRLPILLCALAACGGAAPAPAAPSRPSACASGAHLRDFDFWLGRWDVTAAGKLAGHNEITSEYGGCTLIEHWAGASGGAGGSLNFYDPARKKWREVWIDRDGEIIELEGGLVGGAMVLEGPHTHADGSINRMRGTWTPNPDGSVRQLFEESADDGKTWTVSFDGHYAKAR